MKMNKFLTVVISIVIGVSIVSNTAADDELVRQQLYDAVEKGSTERVRWLLDRGVDVNSRRYTSDWTPLYRAAYHGHIEIVKLLLDRGASVNAKVNGEGRTALHAAASRLDVDIMRLLIDRGADVNAKYNVQYTRYNTETPLFEAVSGYAPEFDAAVSGYAPERAREKRFAAVKLLLDRGADVIIGARSEIDSFRISGDYGLSLLHVAVRVSAVSSYEDLELLELLINRGANVNAMSQSGRTPLSFAVEKDMTKTISFLVDKGADVNAADYMGMTPLHHVVREAPERWAEIMELLLDRGAIINTKDRCGNTPLYYTAKRRFGGPHRGMTQLLLRRGAIVNWQDEEIAREMLREGIANAQDVAYRTPLLDRHADITATDQGWTALHYASSRGLTEQVKLLLDRGAAVNAKNDRNGWTALHWAAVEGHTEIVKLLLARGADVNVPDKFEVRALHLAAREQHFETVKMLLQAGANVNARCHYGTTALHYASGYNISPTVVSLLLNSHANVNARCRYGKTPLHWASEGLKIGIVKVLLERGADANAKESHLGERTPSDVAGDGIDEVNSAGEMRRLLAQYERRGK